MRRWLDDAGLVTWAIGSPIGKIGIEEDFEAHLDRLRHVVDVARALGARNVRMFSFYVPEGRAEEYRGAVLERLRRMAEACAGSGVTLCHENEKGIYGDTAARCLDIHRSVPELAGVFDPANFIQCGQDTAEAWTLLKPHVRYLHIKDALADGSVVPAGAGIGHVRDIVADFLACGGCAMTLEPHLKVFDGLAALERGNGGSAVGRYAYGSGDDAFDAACAALKEILNAIDE